MNISASPLFYLLKERKKKIKPSTSSGDLTQEKEAEHSDIPLIGNSVIISSLAFLPAPLNCMYPKNRLLQPAIPISEELAIVGRGIAKHHLATRGDNSINPGDPGDPHWCYPSFS